MRLRILAAFAFVVGAVLMWFLLGFLHDFGAGLAGMSDRPGGGYQSSEALIRWFACFYFVISAIGLFFFNKRETLQNLAALAHAMILIACLIICSETSGVVAFLVGGLVVGFSAVLIFSPWILIWGFVLGVLRRNDDA